jgi:demethylmenaquinone methyltransferase/2-methoxy-6-polyprenyl-1,4-benzoquinol methylase
MANKFFAPGAERARKVNDLFGTIAPRYDLINDLQSFGLHRFWKRTLLRKARVQPGETALDLCCGTGDIAFALGNAGGQVVGLDFSPPMLLVAQRRQPGIHRSKLCWVRADALKLPFPDEKFDIVTIGYGLRNLASWEQGLWEMRRVAKLGGRVLVLDFGQPENPAWRALYLAYLKVIVPLFGKIFFADADTHSYILESLKHYPGQNAVADKMRDMGFRETKTLDLLGGIMSINLGRK